MPIQNGRRALAIGQIFPLFLRRSKSIYLVGEIGYVTHEADPRRHEHLKDFAATLHNQPAQPIEHDMPIVRIRPDASLWIAA